MRWIALALLNLGKSFHLWGDKVEFGGVLKVVGIALLVIVGIVVVLATWLEIDRALYKHRQAPK